MCAFSIGDSVDTPDGYGIVMESRDEDGEYLVVLNKTCNVSHYKEGDLEACNLADLESENESDGEDNFDIEDLWDEDTHNWTDKPKEPKSKQSTPDQLSLFLQQNTDGKR